MKILRASLRRHWRLLSTGVIAILLANCLELLSPFYLGQAVDAITRGQKARIPLLALAVVVAARPPSGLSFWPAGPPPAPAAEGGHARS